MAKAKPQVHVPAPTATAQAQPQLQVAVATPAPATIVVEPVKMNGVTAENFTTFTKEVLITGYGNKSGAIRGLAALGLKPGPISTHLDIRYQHARNVLSRPLKRDVKDQRDAAAKAAQAAPAGEQPAAK
jgi:hypothetical protein